MRESNMKDFNLRNFLDWEYYKNRLGNTIQKIISIPAALQKIANPVPNVGYPDWLHKRVKEMESKFAHV